MSKLLYFFTIIFYCNIAYGEGEKLAPHGLNKQEIGVILKSFKSPNIRKLKHSKLSGNTKAISFGYFLFNTKELSQNNNISCALCHKPTNNWTDGKKLSIKGRMNTPTLWGVANQNWYFWNGRADSTWSQVALVIENKNEHNLSKIGLVQKVIRSVELLNLYEDLFGTLHVSKNIKEADECASNNSLVEKCVQAWGELHKADIKQVNEIFLNIAKSIAAYIETIEPPKTKFDDFLDSLQNSRKSSTYSSTEVSGIRIFIGKGRCSICHSGRYLRDGEFHDVRIPSSSSKIKAARYNGVKQLLDYEFNLLSLHNDFPNKLKHTQYVRPNQVDWAAFKTPTLRMISKTAPYMHQGQINTLEEVIDHYSEFKDASPANHHTESFLTPLFLSAKEKSDLVAFLKTL